MAINDLVMKDSPYVVDLYSHEPVHQVVQDEIELFFSEEPAFMVRAQYVGAGLLKVEDCIMMGRDGKLDITREDIFGSSRIRVSLEDYLKDVRAVYLEFYAEEGISYRSIGLERVGERTEVGRYDI